MTKLVSLTCCSFLILLLTLTKSNAAVDSNNLIEQTCNSLPSIYRSSNPTEYHDFCVKSLKSDPKSSSATNVKELAGIVLNHVSTKANETEIYALELSSNTTDQLLQRFYATCTMSFTDVYETQVPGAFAALNSNDYKMAITSADSCCGNAYLCCNQFADPSILTRDCNVVHDLALVAVDMIGLLGLQEHN